VTSSTGTWVSSSLTHSRLRSASDRTCVVPRTHSFGDRSFSAAGPRVWNAVPPELRHDISFGLFTLGANWSRICLSRALNHGALWHTVFLRLRNILTYLPTYLESLRTTTPLHDLWQPPQCQQCSANILINVSWEGPTSLHDRFQP